ncbi:MAG: type II toxin-antitoxin system Phd/YefM family antitoxin [Treponema sp.]|nr:type II toxin-antitoxin system Phd/YefM family antitoxin [Treponema sp.]MBD5439123.1 type II toxin-antitoxin system Phd/YefM family antitoxin [Treponema sp.]MBD5443450.1 type II toxin-antitoxin system Phd/YefM family antitoxin [Treponema sp.]
MAVLTASAARASLYKLIDETSDSHIPVIISGKRNNAVLVSESDWNAIQETLYLSSIRKMKESIIEGAKEPLSECADKLDW